ncbi:MAG: HD domain-containing protein [Desulfovibrio sp.]|nr:HD domain-containing protein [Desulfovibrio sp.]MBI4958143.1 HD domain-containing protein [Desulfovibrio sp.]
MGKSRLSLSSAMVIALLTLLWGASITLSIIIYYSSESFLLPHAIALMENAVTSSTMQSRSYLNFASASANLTSRLVREEIILSGDIDKMTQYFLETLRINRYSGIYFGFANGDFAYAYQDDECQLPCAETLTIVNKDGKRTATERRYDANGEIVSDLEVDDPYDPRLRPWFIKARDKGQLTWVDPYIFFHQSVPGITTACPAYDHKGHFIGVAAVDIELGSMSSFLKAIQIGQGGTSFIVDREGALIAHHDMTALLAAVTARKDRSRLLNISEIDQPLTQQAFKALRLSEGPIDLTKPEGLIATFTHDGADYLALFKSLSYLDSQWYIGAVYPKNEYVGPLKRGLSIFYLITLIVTVGATLAALFVSRRITQPLTELEQEAHSIKNRIISPQSEQRSSFREIQSLFEAFGELKAWLREYEESNIKLQNDIKHAHKETVLHLASCAELRDKETGDHLLRISYYAEFLAARLNLDQKDVDTISIAAPLHDVGKLGIPDSILKKPGKLTDEEWTVMQTHVDIGKDILSPPQSEFMRVANDIARYHHEKWDGSGYQQGLKETGIPLSARIVAVVDAFDAITTARRYKDATSFDGAIEILVKESGTHFDPACVKAFIGDREALRALFDTLRNGLSPPAA